MKQEQLVHSPPMHYALMMGSEVEDDDCSNDKLPANPELVWDLLLQTYADKSMGSNGIHPKVLKLLADVNARSPSLVSGPGNLVKSQETKS